MASTLLRTCGGRDVRALMGRLCRPRIPSRLARSASAVIKLDLSSNLGVRIRPPSQSYAAAATAAASERPLDEETLPSSLPSLSQRHFIRSYDLASFYRGLPSPPSPDEVLQLLACFTQRLPEERPEDRVKMAEKAWREFKDKGVVYEARHYNSLVRVYLENRHAFDPEDFLVMMSEDGVAMNAETYALLLQRYCMTGDVGAAAKTLDFMRSKGFSVDRKMINHLVAGHLRAGDEAGAADLTALLRRGYVEAKEDHLARAFALAELGDADRCLEEFVDMKKKFVIEVDEVFETLTRYLTNGRSPPEASMIDSFFDEAAVGAKTNGFPNRLSRKVMELTTLGFQDEAARILRLFPSKSGKKNLYKWFLKTCVNKLPFDRAHGYCLQFAEEGLIDDPLQICLDQFRFLSDSKLKTALEEARACGALTEQQMEEFTLQLTTDAKYRSKLLTILSFAVETDLGFTKDAKFWSDIFNKNLTGFQEIRRALGSGTAADVERVIAAGYLNCLLTANEDLRVIDKFLLDYPDVEYRVGYLVSTIAFHLSNRNLSERHAILAYDLLSRLKLQPNMIGRYFKRLLYLRASRNVVMDAIERVKAGSLPLPPQTDLLDLIQMARFDEIRRELTSLGNLRMILPPSMIEKLELDDLLRIETKSSSVLFNEQLCRRAAERGEEKLALRALSKIADFSDHYANGLAAIVAMYATLKQNGEKARQYLDEMLKINVKANLSVTAFFSLVETVLKNGTNFKDVDDLAGRIASSYVKLVPVYAAFDRNQVNDHLLLITSVVEDQKVIKDYIHRLSYLGLPYVLDRQMELTLRDEGLEEAVAMALAHFQNKKIIYGEEPLLNAIVTSEQVEVLKKYMTMANSQYGERHALLKLAFALYKSEKFVQGKRILKIPGLRSEDGNVREFCERMLSDERFVALHRFSEDCCCVFGIDHAILASFKMKALVGLGQDVAAVDFYNEMLRDNRRIEPEMKRIVAGLYKKLGIEFTEKLVEADQTSTSSTLTTSCQRAKAALLRGEIDRVMREIENGSEFSADFYEYLVANHFDRDPGQIVKALMLKDNVEALKSLAALFPRRGVEEAIAFVYLRSQRVKELILQCRDEELENFLTEDTLQLAAIRDDGSFATLTRFAEEKLAAGGKSYLVLATNVFKVLLKTGEVDEAHRWVLKFPKVFKDPFLSMRDVYSIFVLSNVSDWKDAPKSFVQLALDRIFYLALSFKEPSQIRRILQRYQKKEIEAPDHLKRQAREIVGDLRISNRERARKMKEKESADEVEEEMKLFIEELSSIESLEDERVTSS